MLYMCYTHSYIRMYHYAFRSRRDAHVPPNLNIHFCLLHYIHTPEINIFEMLNIILAFCLVLLI